MNTSCPKEFCVPHQLHSDELLGPGVQSPFQCVPQSWPSGGQTSHPVDMYIVEWYSEGTCGAMMSG